ncbi:hypothetical protein QQS21_010635 [Conoideocrella luteorostrata]|uniref:Rad4-domain-containing protein n=1 Tax=Conoideocrella luteorostrata TaxID=1105319 RepID=A0AAJ0FWN5_9HYPO|nr:hypothetical protein QQS21_010635 [Conoideocrella luteorostrata]
MVGRKRNVPARHTRRGVNAGSHAEPDVYQQMLAEAGASALDQPSPERPLKRRRLPGSQQESKPDVQDAPSHKQPPADVEGSGNGVEDDENDDDDDDDVEFQDVVLPVPTAQTMELESDDDGDDEHDEDEDLQLEDVDFSAPLPDITHAQKNSNLELNLTAHKAAASPSKRHGERRKPLSKEERECRIDIHRMHLLCLLSHVARRNAWCNDSEVQDALRRHLTNKTVNYLTPGSHLPQFGQAESLKNGLRQAAEMWKMKFEITQRGLQKALWAEVVAHLQDYEVKGGDSCLDLDDFRKYAAGLEGSRDVGAQLYCALLRSVGVQARLVCSLQPLSFTPGGPTLPKPESIKSSPNPKVTQERRTQESGASRTRRRLELLNTAALNFQPRSTAPVAQRTYDSPRQIRESAYPIYWVEVLDKGHQKWQPADPVVTHTFWKPRVFEPPITDKENCLSYVVAFEADGTAKDVTRRYAKAYTAKTRRMRVETPLSDNGEWWRKTMKLFRRRRATDLDQIEDIELAGVEAREPMPRNVQDFKDHPVYALERHMRRHEVLVPEAKPSGTVSAGSRGSLEKIYRRKDVRVARSADRWYRMGRDVKPNEIPAKWLQKKARPKGSKLDDDEADKEDDAGTPIYTMEQTELFEPPPVRNGRVPKNKFGNIDAYVPSMIPKGAVHIAHEQAARAAFILGVDYAPALTGFSFTGRHGTAVLNGIVVAMEFEAAIQAVIDGMVDVGQEMENERKSLAALKMWRRLLMGLRIRERIWSGVDDEERKEAEREAELEAELANAESDVTDEFDMVIDDDDKYEGEGGGFLVE